MTDRFPRRALWLFGISVPVALAVLVLAPVPFIRGLGGVALACAALGVALNAHALRTAHRQAYWPVGATLTQVEAAPVAAPAAAPARPARYRATRIEPRLSLARLAELPRSLAMLPSRLPARMTSHA